MKGANLELWVHHFPWESEEQKKGVLNFIQWYEKLPPMSNRIDGLYGELRCLAAYFIQKDHESHVWWQETVGTQIASLQNEIKRLQNEIESLKGYLPVKTGVRDRDGGACPENH